MKKVILIIGERHQSNACGFIREFEKLDGKIDGILCLKAKNNATYHLKKALRFLKLFKKSKIKSALVSLLCRISNLQKMSSLKNSWIVAGENSWDLLENKFDIFQYAKEKNIPLQLSPFLSSSLIKSYTLDGPTIFPLYAGGILTKAILENTNAEFINAHMGEMPNYRGMNVLEWAILENQPTKVAVMIMNEKIDGGDIIWHKDIILGQEKNIAQLRKIGYTYCYKAMAEGIVHYLHNDALRQKQPKGAKYYYRMHKQIRNLLEQKLQIADQIR